MIDFNLRLMRQVKLMVGLRNKLRNLGTALYPMASSKRMQLSISKSNDVASVANESSCMNLVFGHYPYADRIGIRFCALG